MIRFELFEGLWIVSDMWMKYMKSQNGNGNHRPDEVEVEHTISLKHSRMS